MSKLLFSAIEGAPLDPILSVGARIAADPREGKVNLSVGAYLDENGKPTTLKVVKDEEERLAQTEGGVRHYYGPMRGDPVLCEATQKLIFGADSEVVKSHRALTVQTLGGTGAIWLASDMMHGLCGATHGVSSNPTWENHLAIMRSSGIETKHYRYLAKDGGVDFAGLIEDLAALPKKTLTILHACCHNPTGYDLTHEQWKEVLSVCEKKDLIPLLDIAYQGFGEGLTEDAYAVRLFAESGMDFLVSSSFSKNFGLYGERVGALTLVTQNEKEANALLSNAESFVRCSYSNPPLHGASIVRAVLSDEVKRAAWEKEVNQMRERLMRMRIAFTEAMKDVGAKRDFSFVAKQRGMFSFTGLTAEQVERLAAEHGVYAVSNSRVCLCGLNESNIKRTAEAFAAVL